MSEGKSKFGSAIIIIVPMVLGILLISGTLFLDDIDNSELAVEATAEYGQRLLRDTVSLLGPDQANPEMRYSGNRLDCASCHLDTGVEQGTLSLLQSAARYPRFSGRDGGERDLKDRINGCMQRSMNGRPFSRDSVELAAMETYILSLGAQHAAMSESKTVAVEPPAFVEPQRRANVEAGQVVYEQHCLICHGENGEGLKETTDILNGYLFPPVWGVDSYNNGAGMNRVLTAARFIKARMPLGEAVLTDAEAYDVSAYINSQPRPVKSNLEQDYPDLTRKPIDSPYPPYADPFTQEQHKYGPFDPIRKYYESLSSN
ncbi:MAG: c-type cytochrome [Gammaproteobacteria bacterium]|nr:c-type cytochrome [Gammaproteobacteria bacterium]